MKLKRFLIFTVILFYTIGTFATDSQKHRIGETINKIQLIEGIEHIAGIAFYDDENGSFFYIFEGSTGKFYKYQFNDISDEFSFYDSFTIEGVEFVNPRGLEFTKEVSNEVLYFLDYIEFQEGGVYKQKGLLYRYDITNNDLTFLDLNEEFYELGLARVYDVAKQGENLIISFDPSGYSDQTTRVRRGLIVLSVNSSEVVSVEQGGKMIQRPLAWEQAISGSPLIKRHMPGPGKSTSGSMVEVSSALTAMTTDNTEYLWGTVGNKYIYLMDSQTGRGIFFFESPVTMNYNMTFGKGYLWIAEKESTGGCQIHKVNVLDNPELPFTGPKRFRELKMQLTSTVNQNTSVPKGYVYHTYCHPYSGSITKNQGIISGSVRTYKLTGVSKYTIENLYFNPAGDTANRQDYTLVSYLTDNYPSIKEYKSEFYIKYWTREFKQFIYPHLAVKDDELENTRYLDDDEILFGIDSDRPAYNNFINRVTDAIKNEYDVEPNMDNPYWASRNILEYVVENYHYPNDGAGYYATYDFEKGDFNSHPGNLKVSYSSDNNYEDNIIACSGTGSMVSGILRSIGIPGVWIGTGGENNYSGGYFEPNAETSVSNGHRWTKVWLGKLYGWQDVDATPNVPDGNAYDQKPKELSQWEIMQKQCAGVKPHRIIFNVQSEFWDKMYIPLSNNCEGSVNQCGSIRYNLLGTYSNPELFNRSSQIIRTRAIQFINNVNVSSEQGLLATITWEKIGYWVQDPDAKIMLAIKKNCLPGEICPPAYVLADNIPNSQESFQFNLSEFPEGDYDVTVTKVGDPFIGNETTFKLEHIINNAEINAQNDSRIKIYPNPTTGLIYIEAENIRKIELLNSDGRLILLKNKGDLHSIELSNNIRGLYIIKVYTDKKTYAEKIFINKAI